MDKDNDNPIKPKNVWYKKVLFIFFVFGVIFVIFYILQNSGFGVAAKALYNFFATPVGQINSRNGRVNILVMGKAGESHDGPDLTDTMILVSVDITKPSIVLVSIPRDLWIPEIRAKINSAYYWGKNGSPYLDVTEMGGGISFAEIVAGEVIGQPIQYGVVIDFSSFKELIDALGGIQVIVDQSFTDRFYPIAGRENDTCGGNDPGFTCRYTTVSFDSGPQTMKGDTALKFVRSRHAEGTEGTDTAREGRQQKVIDAIKNKISNPTVFLSPKVDLAVLRILKKYVETDINLPIASILARLAVNSKSSIKQYLIPGILLTNPPTSKDYDNQYVFIPKLGNGKWGEINKWFAGI